MSRAQQEALDVLWPRWGLSFETCGNDPATWFGRAAPLILEIGSGMGETTLALARQRPHQNFLAIEVHGPGVGSLLKGISEEHLDNIRVMRHDAVEVLQERMPAGSLAGIHIFFPDPWPKARHHKRRLIQPEFVHLLAKRLAPGGYLHLATDWEDYAEQMLAVLSHEPALKNTGTGFVPRPESRPVTKFEQRGLRLGHGVRDLIFERLRAPESPA